MSNESDEPTAPCQACGGLTDGWIDVEDRGPDDNPGTHLGFRRAVACDACLDAMNADMWVSRAGWESLSPHTPYEQLSPVPD